MLLAVLFTIAKTWKQPQCPSTEKQIKKMWNVCTVEYYPAIKKNKVMPSIATWVQLEISILSELSLKEKENAIEYDLHVESKMWLKPIYRTETWT